MGKNAKISRIVVVVFFNTLKCHHYDDDDGDNDYHSVVISSVKKNKTIHLKKRFWTIAGNLDFFLRFFLSPHC